MSKTNPAARKRIAIVGGGPASLAAAWSLSHEEPEAYDITVYEMSWRLGGKTASGRGEDGRIEEHGLHILFGCYHNVFRMMRAAYDELREKKLVRPEDHWLQYFSDSIAPHHFGVIGDDTVKPWQRIELQFPSNRGVPGDPPVPGLLDLLLTVFQIVWAVVLGSRSVRLLQTSFPRIFDYRNRWKRTDYEKPPWEEENPIHHDASELGGAVLSRMWLKTALACLDGDRIVGKLTLVGLRIGHAVWRAAKRAFFGPFARFWSAIDFFYAMFKGLNVDRVLSRPGGFEAIDDEDLREWLARHGASGDTLASPWMRIIYDAAFSYEKGTTELIAAGAALRTLLVMTITYKGAFYNKMEAGMGDIIHTPLYLVLKSRGVRFEFFHRLTDVTVGRDEAGRNVVETLEFDTLPDAVDYEPLVPIERLLCWPSQPKLGLVPPRSHARAREAESYAPSLAERSAKTLRRERDFDLVVLGVPVACLPHACPSLLAFDRARFDRSKPTFADQAEIDTVQTMALQLWLKPTLVDLGWTSPSPLASLFLDPLNTWCDMSHLLARESWLGAARPKNVAYFCGSLPHEVEFPSVLELSRAPEVHAAIQTKARNVTLSFLTNDLYQLLPAVRARTGFNYNLLIDRDNGGGEERLRSTFSRVNYEPHELCTLALPKKTRFRMHPDATGYDNLFVTGDWINNGIYVACVEGAVQAGIATARAIARETGGPFQKYSIVAEELLNLQIFSKEPDRASAKALARHDPSVSRKQ